MRRARAMLVGLLVLTMAGSMVAGSQFSPDGSGFGFGFGVGDVRDVVRGLVGGDREKKLKPFRMLLGPGLAADEPAPTGKRWPKQKRVRELTERRTANGRFFLLSDGRVQAEVSPTPVHYRDSKGKYRAIDTRVHATKRAGFVAGNTSNTFTSLFGDSTDRLVRFEWAGRSLELGLPGKPRRVTPVVAGPTVTYRGVFDGADLVYEVTPTSLKEQIVVRSKPAAAPSYVFTVRLKGLSARQGKGKSISFTGRDSNRPVLSIPAPFMFDDRSDKASPHGKVWTEKVGQRLTKTDGKTTITVTPDRKWLSASKREYPVTIDPTVKIQPVPSDGQDVQIYSGAPTGNYNGSYHMSVGTDATDAYRSLVQFPLTGVPAGTQLDDARLEMYYDQTHYTYAYDVAMDARRVTAPWNESTATWDTMNTKMAGQPAGNMVTVDDGDTGTSIVGSWPYSTSSLGPKAVNGDYRFNSDTTGGDTHTWVPTITETGDYQVEAHFISYSDRAVNAPYTVHHAGGSTTHTIDQTGDSEGEWRTLGVHRFNAGTSHKVVLGDVPPDTVVADAVRFTRWGVATKKKAISSAWSSFPVRNVVQDWVNDPQTNYGFMVKAVDEITKGRGGPVFEASEYAYNNGGRDANLPKLVLTWGRPGVTLSPPATVTSTGALLDWSAYQDPSGAAGDDIVEYQVHRSVYQTFTPSAATLVAPVAPGTRSYQDSSATPTPADTPDDEIGNFYYYMVAVKTADGDVIAAPTQGVRLPKAGHITKIYRTGITDTTLSAARPDENVDSYDGDPYVSPGNNSGFYGDTRGLVKFPDISGVPTDAQITRARLRMWNTYLYPGTDTDEWVDVHKLTRGFSETGATWNKANSTTAWTTPGGDYDPTPLSGFNGFTNDPEWETWNVKNAVEGWVDNPTSNHGLLLKMRDEAVSTARAMLLSSEGSEPMLRPTLEVTYLEKTPASTYYAPDTPARMIPGDTHNVTVTVSNTTLATWNATDWELSYRWTLPDGTDVTTGGNQIATALPQAISPGETVEIAATVKSPIQSDSGNKRTDHVLKWELRNKVTGQWLSESDGIASLNQNVAVEDPTSNQLGLEKYYAYTGANTGAGSTVMNNLYAGNTVWSYNAFSNPSRGLSTFVRLSYNSLDTSDSAAGYGWSLQASSLMRLGTPLDFHPNPNPTTVNLTDGDGTSHTFTFDTATSTWTSPRGVHLHLQQLVSCGNQTEEDRAWVLTKPDRTQFFYDCDGYLSATRDNNGNELLFTYAERNSNNKPTKFLRYITDPAGRQTLTIDYYAKGEDYDYIDDTTWTKKPATNLTNPHIIDHVKTVTDISGRKLTFTYTDKGLLGELVDGAGSAQPKVFGFQYDMTQGNKNVKLVKISDPRGNATDLAYYTPPQDDPKFHWTTKTITDRLDQPTTFSYTDPDGTAGSTIHTVVTDAETHTTSYLMDGYGRPTQTTNAKNETTTLGWDADNNVTRLEEANGAVSEWTYDPQTGYPLEIRDAEAVANGWVGTFLTYQTQLDGHVADLTSKTSPEGRKWTFGYSIEGDLEWIVDPVGNTTAPVDDYKTSYTYDTWGQLLTATDANGNTTTNSSFEPNGYPESITDPLNNATTFTYDKRGQVTKVTDALGKDTTQTYDTFGRPLENKAPKDQSAGRFITTPAPEYDANDNVTTSTAPNGAITTAVYNAGDQLDHTLAPVDNPGDPQRKTSFTYDKVGNPLTTTEPKGNLTPETGDFTTTNNYDEIYQLTSIVDAAGNTTSYEYDNVGNMVTVVDARKNATTDTTDYTTKYTYDRNRRVTAETDATGQTAGAEYDRDGLMVASIDVDGNRSETAYDDRGMVKETRVPHVAGVTRITRYEYDEVGNVVRTVSPRGVATNDDPEDFSHATVYDALNRAKEKILPFDKDDSRYNSPDKIQYTYDAVGRVTKVSAPPSEGQTVRNDTLTSYFDNGSVKSSQDPWDIVTTYDYNDLGLQTRRELTSAGGSSGRAMTWDYYPDGKLRSQSDSGVPVGGHVVLVDNSDTQHTSATGTWGTSSSGTGFQGYDYHTHAAGLITDTFTWRLTVPTEGTYEVFVKYAPGTATDAAYTVKHATGTATRNVDQTRQAGEWVSVGSYSFTEGTSQQISLAASVTGMVVADGVKLVRDNSGDIDTEAKTVSHSYDANGNLTSVADGSSGAGVDSYLLGYDGLDRLEKVEEKTGGAVRDTTTYTYDPNSNLRSRAHNRQTATFDYGTRDLVSNVTVSEPGVAEKTSTFSYTTRGQREREVKGNGNIVDYTYHLDGLLHTQVEKKPNGLEVASHSIDYDANSNRSTDVVRIQNADDQSRYLDHTYNYDYDPRDRLSAVTKTPVGGSASTENYVHDANDNVISRTVGGVATIFRYDRNRLQSATALGRTIEYNYDPYGRLDTTVGAGEVIEKYTYDGFDRVVEHRTGSGADAKTTEYSYDPLDRTTTRTDKAGTPEAKTTAYHYLGTSPEVVAEETVSRIERSYQYGPAAERLSMVKFSDGAAPESSYYSYNPHTDVDAITDESGSARATYGYTAYGSPDDNLATGVDKPDQSNPDKEPYNPYRFNNKRVNTHSGTYDMGFRDYSPDLNRFLSRDLYNGALADLAMIADPFTMNRYAFTSGNPINRIENDGHCWDWLQGACDAVSDAWDATKEAVSDAWDATQEAVSDAWQATEEAVSDAWEATKQAASDAADWVSDNADTLLDIGVDLLEIGVGATALVYGVVIIGGAAAACVASTPAVATGIGAALTAGVCWGAIGAGVGGLALAGAGAGLLGHGASNLGKDLNTLFSKKTSRRSGKERASDAPSWARGSKKQPGESTEDAIKRIYEENGKRLPPRKDRGPGSDYSKIKKYVERGGR